MKNTLGNIAQEHIRIIRESIQICHPVHIMPPIIKEKHYKHPMGLFAFGKSALSMAEAFLNHTPVKPEFCFALTSPLYRPNTIHKDITLFYGDHPFPGKSTLDSSRNILNKLIHDIPAEGEIVLLISGGGSSLFEIPESPYTIEQISSLTKKLMLKGADIFDLNTIRKYLSAVKGGKLAMLLYPRSIFSLIMSDVMGDNPEYIASGPVTPDGVNVKSPFKILKEYDIDIPDLIEHNNRIPNHYFKTVESHIISNNESLLKACENFLNRTGLPVIKLPYTLGGEARQCGKKIAGTIVSSMQHIKGPSFFLAGGECSVTVSGNGKGGRNLELVMGTALELAKFPFRWVATSIGSDGFDGPTDAAGGWLSSDLLNRNNCRKAEMVLENNNTYPFFEKLHSLIKTGYTGINLNDLFLAYIEPYPVMKN